MKLVIFGCGKIAKRIASSCKLIDEIELVGFASKDIEKAKQYAQDYSCDQYGEYDYFLNSDVDAIYIATYNNSHYELIEKALMYHKNVICEKPMLFSVEANEKMFALAKKNDVLLMEALKSVFLPINIKVKQMIKDKIIGDTKEVYASFMRNGNHPKTHWINDLKTGGALKDLGSYCVGTLNYLLDTTPIIINKQSDASDEHADTTTYLDLDYDGIKGKVSVSNSIDGDTCLTIKGSKGYIHIENFWKTGKGIYVVDDKQYQLDEECISDFYYELKHFAYLVDNNIKQSNVMDKNASNNILKITGD